MTAPGWYPDPSGSDNQRYWDGMTWTEHQAPARQQLSESERSAILFAAISHEVATYHCRVESQTPLYAVLVYGSKPNHVVWALLSIFTCGLLLIGWIIVALTSGETRKTLTVDPYGQVIRG